MQAMNPGALHRLRIFVGVAVGPSVFGKLAPSYVQLFGGPSTLTRLTAWASWQSSSADSLLGLQVSRGLQRRSKVLGVDLGISFY